MNHGNEGCGSEVEEDEGSEICPICSHVNHPGDGECCDHFLGTVWDGEFIWGSDELSEGGEVYSLLAAIQSAWDDASPDRHREWETLLSDADIDSDALDRSDDWTDILEEMPLIEQGPDVETDGMLSGSGYSLYHPDPKFGRSLAERLRAVRDVMTRGAV